MELKVKVLIVEKERELHNLWSYILNQKKVGVLSAYSIKEAEELFSANPDVKIVAIGRTSNDYLNTLPLTRVIRQRFKGPMIAVSNIAEDRRKLMETGCNYECELRYFLPAVIFEILGFFSEKGGILCSK